jgi:hypothetical protein
MSQSDRCPVCRWFAPEHQEDCKWAELRSQVARLEGELAQAHSSLRILPEDMTLEHLHAEFGQIILDLRDPMRHGAIAYRASVFLSRLYEAIDSERSAPGNSAASNASAPAGQSTQLERERELADQLAAALAKCNFSLGQAIDRAERHSMVGEGPYTWEDHCANARAALAQHAAMRAKT